MPDQSNHLVSYLDRVRNLETDNWRLESKIWEHLKKKGPQIRDWGHYFKTVKEPRAQIFANFVHNARTLLQKNDAGLVADDVKIKYETELAVPQSMESDIHGLHEVIDNTNVIRLPLETEIKALEEGLLFLRRMAHKPTLPAPADRGEHHSVTAQSPEIGAPELTLMELRRKAQFSGTDLDFMRNLKASLENSLREEEARYTMQMEQLSGVLLHLELVLAQTWAEGVKGSRHRAGSPTCWKAELEFKDTGPGDDASFLQLEKEGLVPQVCSHRARRQQDEVSTLGCEFMLRNYNSSFFNSFDRIVRVQPITHEAVLQIAGVLRSA
ncbi:Keratin, type I cytoskeletal 18 [Tupaia chinensis]|uniref:Keratin, type I cytoskeletal 18 n=1 Tax=Tupaia chinensis TaxID=246437 RepID=L9JF41_TUPCH|nr:Keratin, type I cytoskeletal 18 [Tupaia chinensis]